MQKTVNLFDELVADLKRENLLDSGFNESFEYSNNLTEPVFHKTEAVFAKTIKETSPIQKPSVKIEAVQEIKTENIVEIKSAPSLSNQVDESETLNYNPVLLLHPVKAVAQPKVQIKPKQKGRFCKTCMIAVPYHRFSCKFCGERVTGKFVYYPLIILFAIILVAVFLIIIASKNYN